jgi:Peptidase family M48
VARLPLAARLGRWSPEPLQAGQPSLGWGVLAGAVAGVLLAGAILFAARAGRDLARAVQACRELDHGSGTAAGPGPGVRDRLRAIIAAATGTGRVVITRDDRPLAYAVPLPAGAIVVSTGMLQLLSPAERRALLAHESAHLRQYHALSVLLADLAASANPLLRPLAAQVRLATELAADERAASEVGDRRVVARALARVSLAAAGRPGPDGTGPDKPGLGGPASWGRGAGGTGPDGPGSGTTGPGGPGSGATGPGGPGSGMTSSGGPGSGATSSGGPGSGATSSGGPGSPGLGHPSHVHDTTPAGMAPAGGLAIADTHASTRVRALLEPPGRRRPWAAATAVALTLASAATAITLTLTTHQQMEQAQLAYARAHPAAPPEAGPPPVRLPRIGWHRDMEPGNSWPQDS